MAVCVCVCVCLLLGSLYCELAGIHFSLRDAKHCRHYRCRCSGCRCVTFLYRPLCSQIGASGTAHARHPLPLDAEVMRGCEAMVLAEVRSRGAASDPALIGPTPDEALGDLCKFVIEVFQFEGAG